MFPAHRYYTSALTRIQSTLEWHEKGKLGGYYPLLRRDLIANRQTSKYTDQARILCFKYCFGIS